MNFKRMASAATATEEKCRGKEIMLDGFGLKKITQCLIGEHIREFHE
jgi:acyl CoA:acetate/3-ketoacid CoA transferase alpha subunit